MSVEASLQELGPGDTVKATHPIDKLACSLGTDTHTDIQLRGKGIAEVHATVRTTAKGIQIESVGSGRLVINGRRTDSHVLQAGDLVDIGSVRLRFHVGRARSQSGLRPGESELLTELAGFAETVAQSYDVDTLLEAMLESMVRITHAARGVVLLLHEGKPQVRTRKSARGEKDRELAISDSIVERVLKTRQPVVVSDALSDREFNSAQSVMDFKICSVLCVPLLVRGDLLGAIYLGNDNVVNLFSDHARDLATVFAAQAALVLRDAFTIRELQLSNAHLTQQIQRMNFGSLVGACSSMKELFKRIEKVAPADVGVLVEGETGTGKELVASELHRRSSRKNGPFVAVNCGAIPENLLESELFGHVRGAFTGAVQNRDGKFQAAHGGTLFLDEIGEMPLILQVKLLRVLEERRVVRVGESHGKDVDIRVVAATNRHLVDEVRGGRFREDLYYRLNIVNLTLPPLRERGEDIGVLARYFLKRHAEELQVAVKGFAQDAERALHLHRWPGNIRELDNRVKKAVLFCDTGTVTAVDLELDALLDGGKVESLNEAKERFARGYVQRVLDLNGGNRSQTAKDLDVDVRTVYRYLERDREEDIVEG
ncbi:MAG: GAF domain-containing protein [Myxococcales bacterium]|nr:GAF domain-containing protein [Myxococcales bacterium]